MCGILCPSRPTRAAPCALLGALLSAGVAPAQVAPVAATQPSAERSAALAAWEGLRYGMFIHFGLATFNGDELGRQRAPIETYAPTALDVEQWIRTARDAGMKYAVLTTKHCTGHCLWPSKATDFDVEASSVKVDVVGEFVRACRKYDLKPGFYYLLGWEAHHQPAMTPAQYEQFCTAQLEELLTRYGPIVELWLDIPSDMGPDAAGALRRIYAKAKSLQPECLVMLNQGFTDGSKVSLARPSYFWKEVAGAEFPLWPRDLIDGERTLPPPAGHDPHIEHAGQRYYVPMETCDTLGRDWFWGADDALRSVSSLHRQYRACIERRANFLLDVPPDRSGRIPPASVKRLMELRAAIDAERPVRESVLRGGKATASNVYHGDPRWGADKLTDDDFTTRWATDDAVHDAWVRIDFDQPTTFDAAYLTEGWNRTRAFEIQIPDAGGSWKAAYRGERIGGDGLNVSFPAVTARAVRLHILDATVGPTIWDFELYQTR